jgi:hypothetical protein
MMHQLAFYPVTAGPDRHFQRIEGQLRAQRIRDLPAGNHPGMQIENERGIDKAGRRLDVSDGARRTARSVYRLTSSPPANPVS